MHGYRLTLRYKHTNPTTGASVLAVRAKHLACCEGCREKFAALYEVGDNYFTDGRIESIEPVPITDTMLRQPTGMHVEIAGRFEPVFQIQCAACGTLMEKTPDGAVPTYDAVRAAAAAAAGGGA
jgi:hypothetical protein